MIVLENRIYWQYVDKMILCYILTKDAKQLICRSATCGKGDTYNKEYGRRLSLKRCLLDLYHGNGVGARSIRKIYWDTYRILTKKPKW